MSRREFIVGQTGTLCTPHYGTPTEIFIALSPFRLPNIDPKFLLCSDGMIDYVESPSRVLDVIEVVK